MFRLLRICSLFLAATFVMNTSAFAQSARTEGRVTQVIREVNVFESALPPRRAVLNETLGQGTAVRTGGNSRAELTFVDLTITRLGANTLYSFKRAGREVELNSGSTLLRVPKGGGAAKIVSPVITAGITGTTVILESTRAGEGRLTVLEGSARLTLARYPSQARTLQAGQTLHVSVGATRVPEPAEVDLDRLLKTSPLIIGFRPLPSLNLINSAIRNQQQRAQLNQPNRNAPPGRQNQRAPVPAGPRPAPGPR